MNKTQGLLAFRKEHTTLTVKELNQHSPAVKVVFNELEGYVRNRIQNWIQDLLFEQVTELLGRNKSERLKAVDARKGYRNGYGKARKLCLMSGTITLSRPRVRNPDERFESRILELFARRSREVGELLPELYLHGLSQGDFELALRGLLGEGAPLSESSIAGLKAKWEVEYDEWNNRPLDELEVVYLWVDGIYVKAGLERDKACVLVALAGLSDGSKVFVGLQSGYRESTESWASLLRSLKARGLKQPRLVVGDGCLGIWAAIGQVWPEASEQRCWNHRMMNILDRPPKKLQGQARMMLREIAYATSLKEAERDKKEFQDWCESKGCEQAARLIEEDWERMVSYYNYPREHCVHLRTSNAVESPFSAVRLRTDASRRYKKVENATAMIWKTLMIAEKNFRKLNAAEMLKEVYEGARFADGVRVKETEKEVAA